MARATAHIDRQAYATTLKVAGRTLIADEPIANGGGDAGPAPYDYLLAALGACTAITLRMYADHKGWLLESVEVSLHFYREGNRSIIERTVSLTGALNDNQKSRLADITERTPVTLTLKQANEIQTRFTVDGSQS